MKRLCLFTLILAALMLACNIPGQETPAPGTDLPSVPSETPDLPETPTVTETPTIAVNTTCNEISFFLDPALASGSTCETIPAANGEDPWAVYPQHTRINFQGYVLGERFHNPMITVFPLPAYLALTPGLSTSVAALQALLAGGTPGSSALPLLGLVGAAQEFHAQYQVVAFTGGSGIRYLTQYAQYYAPINNHDMFYTFQGLTGDGQYWISIILPISNPILPGYPDPIPGGVSPEEFGNNFDSYIADIVNQLNAQPAASFMPSLALLDALVQSITIHA